MRLMQSLAAALTVTAAAVAGLPAVTAQGATTAVPLPISQYSHMLVDATHKHLFITSGSGSSSILVTDFSGQTVATIPNEPGAAGLALSGDGSTVYAALPGSDAISAISTSTLTETARYDTGASTGPTYVACTSGKIWFGYNGIAAGTGGIGSIDPSTSPATVTLSATPGSWYAAPMLTASPGGELVAGDPIQSPTTLASYDVSSGAATVLAPQETLYFNGTPSGFLSSMAITPDGKDVVVAISYPSYHPVYRVSDLSADGTYPTTVLPDSVSISSDGTVAAGTVNGTNEIFMFAPGGSTPLNTYNFGSNWLVADGAALTPDGSELFAVTMTGGPGGVLALNMIPGPEQTPSTLSLTGPASVTAKQPITLSGTLGGTSPQTGGQTLHVTRTDKADPRGITLPDVTTAADGSFSITDTPRNGTKGTVTYQVSYAGNVHLTASSASISVTISH
jgi:sugar lactone lactonase YvrE